MVNAFWRSYQNLCQYRPLAVTAAPDQIALARGSLSYKHLMAEVEERRTFLLRAFLNGLDIREIGQELLIFDPIN